MVRVLNTTVTLILLAELIAGAFDRVVFRPKEPCHLWIVPVFLITAHNWYLLWFGTPKARRDEFQRTVVNDARNICASSGAII